MRFLIVLALLCPIFSFSQQHRSKPPAPLSPVNGQRSTLNPSPPSSVISHLPSPLSPLSIGDTLPAGILDAKRQTPNGKPLLLSFFATWCGTCLKEVPKLVAFQKQYGDSLGVLLVTYESNEEFAAAQKRNSFWASLKLPVVTTDTLLRQLFPYRMVPHTVWIGQQGTVQAITGAEELTPAHIRSFVLGEALTLPLKKDVLDFDPAIPLLQHGNGGNPALLLSRSSFTRFLPGMPTSSGSRREGEGLRTWSINQPVLSLYASLLTLPPNRILLEVKDTSRFFIPEPLTTAWKTENLYSYELLTPAALPAEKRQQWALQDLNRYLGLSGRFQRRTTACQVLVRTGSQLPKAENPPASRTFTLAQLLAALNRSLPAKPPGLITLDETGLPATLPLKLSAGLTNLPSLRKDLQRYGLDLLPAERELEVFVITEEKGKMKSEE